MKTASPQPSVRRVRAARPVRREGSSRGVPRFSLDHMDRSVDPAKDFYRFASGKWIRNHPVRPDRSAWNAFAALRDANFRLLRGLLEEAAKSRRTSPDASRRKVGTFYAAAMNSSLRRRRGVRPIESDRRTLEAARTVESLPELVGMFHRNGTPGIFSTDVAPDKKRSSTYALYLIQGGLSLPDRDYYLLDRFSGVRTAYRVHVARMFRLAGLDSARARDAARAVLSIETALARASRSRVELREAEKNYHRVTLKELDRRYPRLRWSEYLRRRGIRGPPFVVVGQPEFFDAVNGLLGSTPIRAWKSYLLWQLIHDGAPYLHPRLVNEDFAFFSRRLLGQRRPEAGWMRATTLVDSLLGEALGRLYVDRYFPKPTRARVLELVEDIRGVFRDRLERVPWMTPRTRRRAVVKFDRFRSMVGHPARYRNYARVRVSPRDCFGNVRRARAFEIERNVARIGSRVDRDEWRMTPPTVNAYFVPTQNEIFFPAGILQPPFFDPSLDDAVNFGGIAAVIGHEITHGFDDQGRKYDARGNLRDWWTPADAREFRRRARRMIAQYSRFEPLPGLRVNGALTAGENIADLGGVSVAYEALSRRLADGRTPSEPIDGFTPEQRFFLSYGQVWRGNIRDGELRRQLLINPHAPREFRVKGVLSNFPPFWKAFGVPEGSPMRQDRGHQVTIW